MQYYSYYDSPLGKILLGGDGVCLNLLAIEGQLFYKENLDTVEELFLFSKVKIWLDEYFQGKSPLMNIPLSFEGTLFQKCVWSILLEIPYGTVTTYGAISREVMHRLHKAKMSSQAVGQAIGHNPISILIPCHRVIGSTGKLTGYAGGIEKKMYLLSLEKEK